MKTLRNVRVGRGFTLLEVLIGVLVLALALLGLAAVFPVVVRTQRIARDTVLGTAMLDSAETMLRNHELVTTTQFAVGIKELTRQIALAPLPVRTMWEATLDAGAPRRFIYTDGGALRFAQNGPTMLASDRLNLMFGAGSETDPTLIWDVAMCLAQEVDYPSQPVGGVLNGDATQPQPAVRMAIFVRRLDPRIRVRTGQTLLQAIENGSVVPIGSSQPQFGDATQDGTGYYSAPMYVTVTRVLQSRRNGPWDILEVQAPNNGRQAVTQAIGQNGQLLVDNRGGVHTVVRNVKDAAGNPIYNQVLLEKGLSSRTQQLANDASHPVQLAFTAQVPAAVRVITYKP